jgi:stage III sporulation protein AA
MLKKGIRETVVIKWPSLHTLKVNKVLKGEGRLKEIISIFPETIANELKQLPSSFFEQMEEIRIRLYKPIEIIAFGKPHFLHYEATKEDGMMILNKISQYSIYTLEEELKRGFITIGGGHRIGLAGKVITENGNVKAIRHVTSFNIRIAREKIGLAEQYIPYVYEKKWLNTLIFGPPQSGKTTLLRDFARIISTGVKTIPPQKVGIVDERSEIAGSVKGIPQFTFGLRIDVLDGCPKAEGMMMLIRSMSPDIIIADEIGRKEDTDALMEAVNSGVQLFVSAHGECFEDLLHRPTLRELIQLGIFDRYMELEKKGTPGTVSRIFGKKEKEIVYKAGVK